MMKITRYFLPLLFLVVSACSGDDSPTQEEVIPDPVKEFEFSLNGTPVTLNYGFPPSARKNGHNIHYGSNREDTPFLVSFDENGNFGKIVYIYHEPISGIDKKFTSYANYSSNYFTFELVSNDSVKKWVKVNYSGYLYRNPLDLNSESKFVNGSFNMPYRYYVPTIAGIGNEATINGNYWRATNTYQERNPNDFFRVTTHTLSDDEYKIMLFFKYDNTGASVPGTYNFTESGQTRVQIARFNPETATYILYTCTGSMNVSTLDYNFIKGTYTLNGVNPDDPNDTITVTDGKFKIQFDRT